MLKRFFPLFFAFITVVAIAGEKQRPLHPHQTIKSYQEVAHLVNKLGPQDLVIFDIDDTLLYPQDVLFRHHFYFHPEYKKLKEDLLKAHQEHEPEFTKANFNELWYQAFFKTERNVMEPMTSDFIAKLQAKGVGVIALTKSWVGELYTIESIQELRYTQLKNFGIEFVTKYPNFVMTEFMNEKGKSPVFYKGIILTNDEPKGKVLISFLNTVHLKPRKIIFFDDTEDNLHSVGVALDKAKIPYVNYHYRQVEEIPAEIHHELAKFQIHYFLVSKEWLCDHHAAELLKRMFQ